MCADSCVNESILVSDIGRAILHGDAEGPLIGSLQFFIAQTRIEWIDNSYLYSGYIIFSSL